MHASDSALLRVLIVEDEPLGYRRLAEILAREPDVELVGWAQDTATAIESIRELRPNAVFLDVQMPDGTGLDVVEAVGESVMPPTVFVTAHDRYAIDAFRLPALDYLLKPYTDRRVHEALRRFRAIQTEDNLQTLADELRGLIEKSEAVRQAGPPAEYLKRIAIEQRGRMRAIPVETIDRIDAQGVYAEIHVGSERHLLREAIQKLEEKLDPAQFCRIHRSHLVRLDFIELYVRGRGAYEVQTKSGATIPVGRSYRKELERRLGCL